MGSAESVVHQLPFLGLVPAELADPNIAEPDGISVVLDIERTLLGKTAQRGGCRAIACNGCVILNKDAVVKNGEGTRLNLAGLVFFWCVENDVVGLPFAGLAAGVHQRGLVPIEGATLAVGVGRVVVVVQDLDLITSHQIDSAVPATLSVAVYGRRRGELNMKLAVAELLF